MDPGRYHRSPATRLLWLGMPPLLLAGTAALSLGFERLVHERLDRTRALLNVLPGLEAAAHRAARLVAPLAPPEKPNETTERLHTLLTDLVRAHGIVLNSLAIERHEEQSQAGATRLRISASLDGRFSDLAELLAHLQEAEPLLVTDAGRWTYVREEDDEGLYRAELLFSLYRVTP